MAIWLLLWLLSPEAPDQDSPGRAAELDERAAELCNLGRYDEAARYQARALVIWDELSKTRPVDLAAPHFNLASIYLAQGKLTLAEREARSARQLAGQHTTPVNFSRISVLIAQIDFRSERYAQAEQELRATLPRLNGEMRFTALNDLGMVRAARGDLAGARRLLESSLAGMSESGAGSGPGLGRVLGNLALVCFRQGDLTNATAFYSQAIPLLEATPGPNRTELGMALAEYSHALRKSGRKAEARQVEQRAKEILGASVDPSFHNVDLRSLR